MKEEGSTSTPDAQVRSAESVARMPKALRALALRLGSEFAGLSGNARHRLAAACDGFAEGIQAAEDAPEGGVNLRPWARFLLSALFVLLLTEDESPLSEEDEGWLVAEIEGNLADARTLLEARAGAPPAPTLPQPPPLVTELRRL